MPPMLRSAAPLGALLSILCACDRAPACDAATLSAALDGASAGDVVEVGDCEVTGRFAVGAGVSLEGTGPASAIVAGSMGPALRLTGGADIATTVRGLRVEARGHAAIYVEGGSVALEDLVLDVPSGVGVAAQSVDSLVATRVAVDGGLDASAAAAIAGEPTSTDQPTHGVALFDVGDAQLEDVTVRGFASFGVLAVDSTLRWEGGGVSESRGTGVMLSGGAAELLDIGVRALWARGGSLVPSYGLVVAGGADVRTERVEIAENAQLGVLQDGSTSEHVGLSVHDNGDIGLWAQDVVDLVLGGDASLARNRVAGVVLLDAQAATLAQARIDETLAGPALEGFGLTIAGDGVHILGGRGITLRELELTGNDRVQVLVDLGSTRAPEIVLDGVTVDGAGAELGLVAQNGATPADWESGVTRLGDTAANDALRTEALDVLAPAGSERIPGEPPGGRVDGIVMPVD